MASSRIFDKSSMTSIKNGSSLLIFSIFKRNKWSSKLKLLARLNFTRVILMEYPGFFIKNGKINLIFNKTFLA